MERSALYSASPSVPSSQVFLGASYHFKYFAHAYTALSTASKTSIRLQPDGVMSIQCIFPPSTDERVPVEEELTRNGFVDMLIAPLASDEDGLE